MQTVETLNQLEQVLAVAEEMFVSMQSEAALSALKEAARILSGMSEVAGAGEREAVVTSLSGLSERMKRIRHLHESADGLSAGLARADARSASLYDERGQTVAISSGSGTLRAQA